MDQQTKHAIRVSPLLAPGGQWVPLFACLRNNTSEYWAVGHFLGIHRGLDAVRADPEASIWAGGSVETHSSEQILV